MHIRTWPKPFKGGVCAAADHEPGGAIPTENSKLVKTGSQMGLFDTPGGPKNSGSIPLVCAIDYPAIELSNIENCTNLQAGDVVKKDIKNDTMFVAFDSGKSTEKSTSKNADSSCSLFISGRLIAGVAVN